MNQTEAYYGLPSEIVFCKRCVISNQRPSSTIEFKNRVNARKTTIGFDQDGICSACRFNEYKNTKINWEKREKELIALCDRHRSKDGSYDCIVPGSGGKDSGFVAHQLKYKYGMNPLTVTWAPHKYTEIGFKNFQSWIHSGFDNLLITPNGKLHSLVTRLAFENLAHPFQPFILGQKLVAPKASVLYNIPLIFYGENPAEYGSNSNDSNELNFNDSPTMDPKFFASEFDINQLYLGGVSIKDLVEKYGVDRRDLNPYIPADHKKLKELKTEVHYFGYYTKWDPQECFYYCVENTGFQPNPERTEGSYSKYSSIDDRLDPLHYYTTFIKYGLGRASYDAAQEIRTGKITREEGVALVQRYDSEFPAKYFKEMLEYMNISETKFWDVIDRARSPHLWEKIGGEWKFKHQVS